MFDEKSIETGSELFSDSGDVYASGSIVLIEVSTVVKKRVETLSSSVVAILSPVAVNDGVEV